MAGPIDLTESHADLDSLRAHGGDDRQSLRVSLLAWLTLSIAAWGAIGTMAWAIL
jgi:hypothetical protein